jgi:mRNA (2'-O-methyladenosine-N6-)-methyltransferase
LDYGTLGNEEIRDMDIGSLSDRGFCFLWVINSQLQFGLECLNHWGYTYVDRVSNTHISPSRSLPVKLIPSVFRLFG